MHILIALIQELPAFADANVVVKNRNVKVRKMLVVDLFEGLAVEILGKVVNDDLCARRLAGRSLNQLNLLRDLCKLLSIARNEHDVEPKPRQVERRSLTDAICAACDHSP